MVIQWNAHPPRRESRIITAGKVLLLRVLIGLTVLAVSFCVALYIIDLGDDDRRAALQRDADEVAFAQADGLAVDGGVRVYSSSPEKGSVHTAARAFVGARSPDRFWEAESGFPVNLIVLLPAARTIEQYKLTSGELTERMPSAWVLEGSRDGIDWFSLDRQGGVARWGVDETRAFRVATRQPVTLLRFRFVVGFEQKILRIYGIELR
jgi:hypothetical protein